MTRKAIPILAVAILLVSVLSGRAAPGDTLQVSFIDVGQGDAALIRDSGGFDVLIDGGLASAGPAVVAYLREQGVDDVDVMVATHADSDHIGGLIGVLADIPVRQVLYNGYPGDTATWSNFVAAVASEGISLTAAQFPATYTWGAATAYVLNPVAGLANPEQNDVSVVVLVDHADIEFLFAGDIDAAVEADILARGTPVAAEVLKVAHHGSKYSSSAEFLAAVKPAAAIISVGDNPYGHPTEEALSRLLAAGAKVWRTDEWGTILAVSDGASFAVSPATVYYVYLPMVRRDEVSPTPTATQVPPTATATQVPPTATSTSAPPTETPTATTEPLANLRITELSGTTTPEYVTIQNFGTGAQDMTGWKLVSEIGPQTFDFPAGYLLAAGATVRIESYTGARDDPPAVLFWTSAAVWNNNGDKAVLYNNVGTAVSSMCYGDGCP